MILLDGAATSAAVWSLVETARENGLNIYQYLYFLLLYMLDHKDGPAGIKQMMPCSDFIEERCLGITDTEKTPENCGNLPI